jgi:hypothetical protein
MGRQYLVQDIETIPESDIADEWKPTPEEVARGNGDPFPPTWAHRVITIGALVLDEQLMVRMSGCCAGGATAQVSEEDMVRRWSDVASGDYFNKGKDLSLGRQGRLKLVDFNGREFDVPVLQFRAFRYGIDMSWYFGRVPDQKGGISGFSKRFRDKYAEYHLDVAELFTNHRSFPRPRLKHLAKLMGLPGKMDMDGRGTYQAWKEKRFEEIDRYCMEDVFQTAWIFMRLQLLAGDIGLDGYREAAQALYDWVKAKEGHATFIDRIDLARVLLDEKENHSVPVEVPADVTSSNKTIVAQ